MQGVQLMKLVYVGKRPFKTDNVCGTGTTWFGYGDVQSVERKYVPIFLKHPDIWATVEQFESMGEVKNVSAKAPDNDLEKDETDVETDSKNAEIDSDDSGTESKVGLDSVKAAIMNLEQGNDAHFSSTNGVPIVSAVRNTANDQTITVADVRAAWSELNKG
jgi:hypothetical protein